MPESYQVGSPVYRTPSDIDSIAPAKIAAEDIKSNQIDKPGGGRPNVSADFYKPRLVNIQGIPLVEVQTSNKRFLEPAVDYSKPGYRYFSQNDDYGAAGMIANGNDNFPNRPSNKEISSVPMPMVASIEGLNQKKIGFPVPYDTPTPSFVTPEIYIGPVNGRGRSASAVENRKGDVLKFLYDDRGIREDTAAWLPFLENAGIPLKRENPVYAIGVEHDIEKSGWTAAYYPKKRYQVFEAGFDRDARKKASMLGIPIQDIKDDTISHEALRHGMAEIGGERKDERLQGLIGRDYNEMMAGVYKGTDLERRHKIRAQMENLYAREYELGQSIIGSITESSGSGHGAKWHLANMAWKHGIALGKKGEELEEYVNSRVQKIYGPLDDQPSYKSSGDSGLESKVKASFGMKNGKLATTIDEIAAGEDGARMPTRLKERKTEESAEEPAQEAA